MLIQQDFGTIYGGGELIVGVEKEVGTFTDEHGVTHKRYIKIVDCGQMPNETRKTVSHGIDYVKILSVRGVANGEQSNHIYGFSFPRTFAITTSTHICDVYVQDDVIIINSPTYDLSNYNGYVTLEYYK